MRRILFVATGLVVLSTVCSPWAFCADSKDARTMLGKIGVARGICVVLGSRSGRSAVDLARDSEVTVFVQVATDAEAEAASRAADAAGLLGTRVFVAKGRLGRIGLADNVADAVVSTGEPTRVPEAEVLRVLRPEGRVLLGTKELVKAFPEGVDDWTHHYHGPDNNPQSADRLARAPYLTQFIGEPRYGPAPQNAVASSGRLFVAFGHVAWHEREEPWLNTLIAVNAFNGTLLWKRPLTPGLMVDRSILIATPATLYLGDEKSCKLLDAATGQLKDEIVAPTELTGGTFWKWMALDNGVLYALVGEADKLDRDARWRSTNHGWPWGAISEGYNAPDYRWGMAKTLLAIDPKTKKVLWSHREPDGIDSRALCLRNGGQTAAVRRIYLCSFGKFVACLEAATGEEKWRRTAQTDPGIFQAIGSYRPGHGYIGGWKSTVYMKATDQALYLVGPQTEWLTALSAEDGHFLWKYPARDTHVVIRSDGVYTIGAQDSQGQHTKKLDPLNGRVLVDYPTFRRACTRSVGSPDGILFRAGEGSVRLDLATGKPQWISPMRPSCHIGVLIAGGHLYWIPWTCDCNLQIFGVIACGPAGGFEFDLPATNEERLEKSRSELKTTAAFRQAPGDWGTYRGDNQRSARSPATVPDYVGVLWSFENRAEPTAPVAAGGLVFHGGKDGIVHALDAASGKEQWRVYTGGAIQYPPTVAEGRALVGSGDGWVYAFEAASGRRLWRFRAAPEERRIPVYGALLSTWPVASGVLVDNGVVYCAAGITDYDGTHVYALDASTGEIKWQNNSLGHLDAFSRRGVACQGEMLLRDGKLYLAGGNCVSPGVLDAANGACLNAPPTSFGTSAPRGRELQLLETGGLRVVGQPLYSSPDYPVYSNECNWGAPLVRTKNATVSFAHRKNSHGDTYGLVALGSAKGEILWEQPLPAEPVRWGLCVDSQGRIIVTLRNGSVLCYHSRAMKAP